MRSRNLAIVLVDIVGFTERTGRQSRKESEAWLRRYRNLLLPLVRALGGRTVKSIGDAYLCVFDSPTNALLFGMAAQDRMYDHNRQAPEPERFEIRVAVNAGEVRLQRGDVFGEPVNLAARVEGITPAGEIWFTEAVYLAMTRSEVPSEEVGVRELKGIAEPVRIYRVPRGVRYQLQAAAGTAVDDQESSKLSDYPFGGLGLRRAEENPLSLAAGGLSGSMTEGAARLAEATKNGLARCAEWLAAHRRGLPRRVLPIAAALAALVIGAYILWPSGPYGKAERAIDDGKPEYALTLLDREPRPDDARWQALRARALLRQPKPQYTQAAKLLKAACEKDLRLLTDERVIEDLVACLNRPSAEETIDFIAQRAGAAAVPALRQGAADRRYYLRWNSVRALQKLGREDEVDVVQLYILDLEYGDACSLRKAAARKLAELKDPRALEPLRRATQRSVLDNLCMFGALEEAYAAIEASKR